MLQTPAKTTCGSSGVGIKLPSYGQKHWGREKDITMQNIDGKKCHSSKFKEKLLCDKELEDKRKLRYYKEVINPCLKDKKHLYALTSIKKKINVVKIGTNSHKLHSEIGH